MWKLHPLPIFSNNRPLIMAHRGDSSNIPENSYRAFQDAYGLDVDCLETDVHMTTDGEFVLFHDKTVDRTTDGTGKIADYSLTELKKLDAGYNFQESSSNTFPYRGKGFKIQTIEEIIPNFPNVRFNLDIKSTNPNAPKLLTDKLKSMEVENRVIVGSFHQKQIKKFREFSNTPTGAGPLEVLSVVWKFRKWKKRIKRDSKFTIIPNSLDKIKQNQHEIFHQVLPFYALQIPESFGKLRILSPEFIHFTHYLGISVHVWTINQPEDMKRLLKWGVDGIFTDTPSVLIKVWEDFKK